jgi:hypothetical protein
MDATQFLGIEFKIFKRNFLCIDLYYLRVTRTRTLYFDSVIASFRLSSSCDLPKGEACGEPHTAAWRSSAPPPFFPIGSCVSHHALPLPKFISLKVFQKVVRKFQKEKIRSCDWTCRESNPGPFPIKLMLREYYTVDE